MERWVSGGYEGVPTKDQSHFLDSVMQMNRQRTVISVQRLWGVALLLGLLLCGASAAQDDALPQPRGLDRAGIYALRQIDPNLTGQGVSFGIVCRSVTYRENEPQNDYRPNINHTCFENAKISFGDDGSPEAAVSAHSTAICSILFGQDSQGSTPFLGSFLYQGVAPEAEGNFYEMLHFGKEYVFDQVAPPVDLISASFGFQFENWWTRGVESLAEHEGLLVVASVGNGTEASDPPLYPGAGSNALGVGVVSSVKTGDPATDLTHFALAYPERSTLGPTEDGRSKPDLIAPGNCLVAATDDSRDYSMSGDWSSFSSPVAAGTAGLLVQAAKEDPNLGDVLSPQGGNCLLKAILMNSATKLPFWHKGRLSTDDDREAPLDLVQGAGMVNAVAAYELLKAGSAESGDVASTGWDLTELDAADGGLPNVYRLTINEPVGKVLTATLVWNRHYSQVYPFERIPGSDTDLRVEVWAIDPTNSSNDLLLDYCDSRVDNVEHIYIPTLPDYRVYELVISHSNHDEAKVSKALERYALAWSVTEQSDADNILWHDLNADGLVDDADFKIILNNKVAGELSPDAYLIGDVNTDGVIDASDLQVLVSNRNRKADWRTENVTN